MPYLTEENPALPMHCIHHRLPSLHLLLGPYAWCIGVPLSGLRDPSGFSNQQASLGCPLRVVQRDMLSRKVVIAPRPCEGGVDNPNIKINRGCMLRSLAYAEINLQTSKVSKAVALQAVRQFIELLAGAHHNSRGKGYMQKILMPTNNWLA